MAIDVTAVKTQITRIKTNIDDAFDEAEAKGATMPTVRNSDNLPETIASITVGGAKITGANEINVIAQANINKGDTVRVTAGTTGISVETTPTTLPAGTGYGCAFNHDGTRLAVAHYKSPYITIYDTTTTPYTKLSDPTTLPAYKGRGCAFNHNGVRLAVAHDSSPYITIYDTTTTPYTKFVFSDSENIDFIDTHFVFDGLYERIGIESVDYLVEENPNRIKVLHRDKFIGLDDEFTFYTFDSNNNIEYEYKGKFSENREYITADKVIGKKNIYINVSGKKLYVKDFAITANQRYFTFARFKPDYVKQYSQDSGVEDANFFIYIGNNPITNVVGIKEYPIEFSWFSSVFDFGNDLQEKTMFRFNLYATKQKESNYLYLGYRTMRRYETFSRGVSSRFDLPKTNNFDNFSFTTYALSSFSESGISIPMKENNFLYIQFLIKGKGNAMINGIKIIYKYNRMLKSFG